MLVVKRTYLQVVAGKVDNSAVQDGDQSVDVDKIIVHKDYHT